MRVELYEKVVVNGEVVDYRYDEDTDTLILACDIPADSAARIAAEIVRERMRVIPIVLVS